VAKRPGSSMIALKTWAPISPMPGTFLNWAICQRPPALPCGQRLRPLAISLRSIPRIAGRCGAPRAEFPSTVRGRDRAGHRGAGASWSLPRRATGAGSSQRAGEDAAAFDPQHAPLAVTRLEQRLQLALGVAPVEEFIDQLAVDLALTILAHPDFLQLAQAQQQAKIGHVLLVMLGRIGRDEPVVPRLADDQLPDQRTQQSDRPARQRTGFQGQAHLGAERLHLALQLFGLGAKARPAQPLPIVIHAAEHTAAAMQVERRVNRICFHGIDLTATDRYAPQQCLPHD